MARQAGFFDTDERLRWLSEAGDPLERLAAVVDFELFLRSRRIEARHADVMAAFEEERDQSLEELRARLAERGIAASNSTLSRFFQRHGMTRKKRPDMRSSRTVPTS